MTISIEEYQRLKREADQRRAEADRAKGAYDQQLKKLLEDFNCSTIEEAEKLLDELKQKEKTADEEFKQTLKEYQKAFGDKS
jgi:uncharacterized protein Yka (UPF0111/DUF47 family)